MIRGFKQARAAVKVCTTTFPTQNDPREHRQLRRGSRALGSTDADFCHLDVCKQPLKTVSQQKRNLSIHEYQSVQLLNSVSTLFRPHNVPSTAQQSADTLTSSPTAVAHNNSMVSLHPRPSLPSLPPRLRALLRALVSLPVHANNRPASTAEYTSATVCVNGLLIIDVNRQGRARDQGSSVGWWPRKGSL